MGGANLAIMNHDEAGSAVFDALTLVSVLLSLLVAEASSETTGFLRLGGLRDRVRFNFCGKVVCL